MVKLISIFFWFAAFYDGFLGALFIFAPLKPYQWFEVSPPNHLGYVQFPAALLIIFAWMFVEIARNPTKKAGMIIYGIMLKVAYCTVVFWYWFSSGIPSMWKQFAIYDLVFLVLFIFSYLVLRQNRLSEKR